MFVNSSISELRTEYPTTDAMTTSTPTAAKRFFDPCFTSGAVLLFVYLFVGVYNAYTVVKDLAVCAQITQTKGESINSLRETDLMTRQLSV